VENPPAVSPSLSTRRPSAASKNLAEQFEPIVSIHDAVRQRAHAKVDVASARERVRNGRPGFDAAVLVYDAGDVTRSFHRIAAAFERIGIASTTQLVALRAETLDTTALMLSWANGDSMPRNPALRLARNVAAVVGNAVLSRAADDVGSGFSFAVWKRSLCPCCGASPDLALSTDKRRTLVCWRCDTMWRTTQLGCLSCGASSSPTLVRIASPYGYELAICNSCGRYLKERRGAPTHALLVERALTAGLDEAAELRGLRV
jgi:formate dehydrogenase maturation protein FdhE